MEALEANLPGRAKGGSGLGVDRCGEKEGGLIRKKCLHCPLRLAWGSSHTEGRQSRASSVGAVTP